MTRLTPRHRWRQVLSASVFRASQRPVKATLLVLGDLMTPSGELRAWREQMVEATGLPSRTLDRHLQRAVEDGWLIREMPAGKRRQAVYAAAIPADKPDSSVRHRWRTEDQFCAPPTRVQNSSSVRHPVANSIETEHSRQRVPGSRRPTRQATHHDGSREERDHDVTSQAGTDGSWLPTPSRRPSHVRTTAGEVA